jgi:hypothetical protein
MEKIINIHIKKLPDLRLIGKPPEAMKSGIIHKPTAIPPYPITRRIAGGNIESHSQRSRY